MPNSCRKQAHLQCFDFDLPFKNTVNIFDRMEIAESIYEGVVIPYKTSTERGNSNCYGIDERLYYTDGQLTA